MLADRGQCASQGGEPGHQHGVLCARHHTDVTYEVHRPGQVLHCVALYRPTGRFFLLDWHIKYDILDKKAMADMMVDPSGTFPQRFPSKDLKDEVLLPGTLHSRSVCQER